MNALQAEDPATTEIVLYCDHPSGIGAEGPISELGRWPVLWRCDGCGQVTYCP